MPCRRFFCVCRAMSAALIVPAIICTVLALGGCEGVPRDTTATPAPPRQPIATGDEQYPAPRSERDTRSTGTPTR